MAHLRSEARTQDRMMTSSCFPWKLSTVSIMTWQPRELQMHKLAISQKHAPDKQNMKQPPCWTCGCTECCATSVEATGAQATPRWQYMKAAFLSLTPKDMLTHADALPAQQPPVRQHA